MPAPVAAILRRMIAKNPDERYQSGAELAAELAPYAVAYAPTWDDQARHAKASLNTITPTPKSGDASPKAPGSELGGTLPPGMSPTPLSGSAEGQILPWVEDDREDRRHSRKALLWSVAVVLAVAGAAAAIFFFNQ